MTKNITVCSLFSALICVGAFIRIPLPALSITLQVLFVLLAGMLLGAKKAIISTVIYIAVGLAGLPVFSAGGGFSYIFNPRFGYLTGFIASSAAVGIICRKKPCLKGYFIAGLCCCYISVRDNILSPYLQVCYRSACKCRISFHILLYYCDSG